MYLKMIFVSIHEYRIEQLFVYHILSFLIILKFLLLQKCAKFLMINFPKFSKNNSNKTQDT